MDALEFFTKRFTAEFAIRPFLKNDPKRTLARMKKWAKSDNKHLRRLASEGLRPLLPWGEKLADFIKDPSPGLAILELLKHDPEEYVRKSVANHMNDFSKHHPELVVSTLLRWNKEAPHEHSKNVAWIVRHASRTLLKKGHLGAMRLQGLGKAQVKCSSLRLSSKVVTVGKKLEVDFSLISQSKVTQKLMIDYAVYHQKANGRQQPKVFKYKVNSLKAGEKLECTLRHSFKPITTRRYYAGEHAIEILVNGLDVAKTNFQLKLSR